MSEQGTLDTRGDTDRPERLTRRQRRKARTRAERWGRRRKRLAWVGALVAFAVVILNLMDAQVRTPVAANGVGQGTFPVVEIAGLGSDGAHFAKLTAALRAESVPVLDFDPTTPGVQPLHYRPSDPGIHFGAGTDIPDLAVTFVLPSIRSALRRAGFDPETQKVDVVAHSMGGLLMRYLVEHPVDGWDHRVDDLVMVATPNHGSSIVYWDTHLGTSSPLRGVGADMRPGSAFLDTLGYREPAGQTYTSIGGDPWVFRWLRSGHHGFDDQVPAESPFLKGAALDTYGSLHGRLLRNGEVMALITKTLRAS